MNVRMAEPEEMEQIAREKARARAAFNALDPEQAQRYLEFSFRPRSFELIVPKGWALGLRKRR
ncbi:hypothetical protein [Gloeobacter kilaueensis]|uniref:Uncharacterized protein n=1 Tax=Gloeobacter kilaueensis (strain ATCC BAA-2537 / CCAP 1431/1 / ULC 316 / JS1) TaxID=1183438 RepID=U5QI66_GLOK1|nr:hypothetical protein [Gloeobacter kilaueensis]AGY57325.1 hypothetical protein GKIL_1079 [Gloeobacter kilaueensis JS1]